MLKVRLNCPICSEPIGARSLEGHFHRAHDLTGVVTLRLHPLSPYSHEPEPVVEKESCTELELEPEAEPVMESEAEAEIEPG